MFSSGLALVSFVDTPSVATALWPFVLSVAGVGVGVLAAHLGGPSVASHARRAAVACVLVASSVELIAAPWGDTPLSLRWIASLAITHAIAILATRLFDTRGRGASLPFALSAALWSAGTTFWSLFTMHRDPSALLVAWPFIAAALAGGASRAIPSTEDERERSLEVSARSLLGSWGSVLLLLAPSAEVLVLDWRDAAFWVRGTVALAGTGLGALWVFRASLSPRQDRPDGAPKAPLTTPAIAFLLVAGAWALETTQAAFREVSLHGGVSFAAAWPYVISAAVFALGSVVGRSNPGVGLALQRSSAVVACASAGVMALVAPQHFGFLVLASALGGAVATAALRRDSEAAEPTSLGAVGVVGIACALGPPAFACLSRGLGAEGKGLLVAGAAGAPLLAYLAVFILANAMVIALAVSASHLAPSERRMLELGSVGTFFGVLGLLSLPHLERDYFFMSTLFVGGAVIIAFGLAKRRVLLVGATSVSLVLESFVQYFAKLHDALPWGLLALGFGLALLALALLFERKVRPHLPELARWA